MAPGDGRQSISKATKPRKDSALLKSQESGLGDLDLPLQPWRAKVHGGVGGGVVEHHDANSALADVNPAVHSIHLRHLMTSPNLDTSVGSSSPRASPDLMRPASVLGGSSGRTSPWATARVASPWDSWPSAAKDRPETAPPPRITSPTDSAAPPHANMLSTRSPPGCLNPGISRKLEQLYAPMPSSPVSARAGKSLLGKLNCHIRDAGLLEPASPQRAVPSPRFRRPMKVSGMPQIKVPQAPTAPKRPVSRQGDLDVPHSAPTSPVESRQRAGSRQGADAAEQPHSSTPVSPTAAPPEPQSGWESPEPRSPPVSPSPALSRRAEEKAAAAALNDWHTQQHSALAAYNHGPAVISVTVDLGNPQSIWNPELYVDARKEAVDTGRTHDLKHLHKIARENTALALRRGWYEMHCPRPLHCTADGPDWTGRLSPGSTRVDLKAEVLDVPRTCWYGRKNVERMSFPEPPHGSINPPLLVCGYTPLDIAHYLRSTNIAPNRHIFIVTEVCNFDQMGLPDFKRAVSANPSCWAVRSDAERFLREAKEQLRDSHARIEGHLMSSSDPYVLMCPDVTVFRGSREEGYPFLEESFRTHTIMTALSVKRPIVETISSYTEDTTHWYGRREDHSALLERMDLMTVAALNASGLTVEETARNSPRQAMFDAPPPELPDESQLPILILPVLGDCGDQWHPIDAFANCLKQWRKRYGHCFHSVYVTCTGRGVADLDQAAYLDNAVNKSSHRLAQSDLITSRAAPWHWDQRECCLSVAAAQLRMSAQRCRPEDSFWHEDSFAESSSRFGLHPIMASMQETTGGASPRYDGSSAEDGQTSHSECDLVEEEDDDEDDDDESGSEEWSGENIWDANMPLANMFQHGQGATQLARATVLAGKSSVSTVATNLLKDHMKARFKQATQRRTEVNTLKVGSTQRPSSRLPNNSHHSLSGWSHESAGISTAEPSGPVVECSLSETQPSHHRSAEEGIAEEGPPVEHRRTSRRMSAKRKSAAGVEEQDEDVTAGKLLEEYKEAAQWMQSRQVRRQSVQSVVGTWNEGVSMGREVATSMAELSVAQRRHSAAAATNSHPRQKKDEGIDEETELEIRRRVREQLMQKHKKGAVEEAAASAQPVENGDKDIQARRRNSRMIDSTSRRPSQAHQEDEDGPPVVHLASRRKSAFDYDAQMAFNLQATLQHRAESDASSDGLGELGVDDAGEAIAPLISHQLSGAAGRGLRASLAGGSAASAGEQGPPPRRHSMLESSHQLTSVGSLMSKQGKEQRMEEDVAALAMGLAGKLQARQEEAARSGLTSPHAIHHRRRQSAPD